MRASRITACSAVLFAMMSMLGCGRVTSPQSGASSNGTGGSGSGIGTSSTTAGIAYDATNAMQSSDSLAIQPYGPPGLFGLPPGIPNGCPYDAVSQSFVCGPDVLRNGLTETHSFQFLDASNAPQTAYDSLTTASIHFASHLSGTTTSGPWSTVDDTRALVESGLAGSETSRTWNGAGNAAHQDSLRLSNGSHVLVTSTVAVTVTNVVVPAPYQPRSWPLSGTIATHLVASGGGRSVDQTSLLTFNGTEFATLTVGDSTFTVDLERPPHGPPGGPCAPPPLPPPPGHGDSTGVGLPPIPGHGPGGPGLPPGPGGPGGPPGPGGRRR
jgi:hypothetical protein